VLVSVLSEGLALLVPTATQRVAFETLGGKGFNLDEIRRAQIGDLAYVVLLVV